LLLFSRKEYSFCVMRHFISSFWLPLTTALLLGVITTVVYILLAPTGFDISNGKMLDIFQKAGYGVGFFVGILLLFEVGILNLLRRILRIHTIFLLHTPIVLLAIFPWILFSWDMLGEPRYTNIAKGMIDFVARPLFWGSAGSALFICLIIVVSLFLKPKK